MFKFLKEKIKNWVKKSKQDIEETVEPVETIEKPKEQEIASTDVPSEEDKEKEEIEEVEEALEEPKEKEPTPKLKKEFEKEPKIAEKKPGFLTRFKSAISYKITEQEFNNIFEDLELSLLENNVALEVVEKIEEELKEQLVGKEIKKTDLEKEIKLALKAALENIIIEPDNIVNTIKEIKKEGKTPFKILFFGINGAGKTTAIAKFVKMLQRDNLSCALAASDTFRAASMEQLQIHADKLGVKMIKHDYGSDPSAVAFDAIKYAEANNIDVVLIDTAGRMHTKDDLLKEMEKISRVTDPDLKVFVAEAIAGNDATEQAKAFNEIIEIDGTVLSKTDIDEKGGTIISISYVTKKPILYIGTGQDYYDLELFDKEKFISQLGLED